jgi:enoyl-CoA hydratase/carnithine racemase
MSDDRFVEEVAQGGVALFTLNRPASLNAINSAMAAQLGACLDRASHDGACRAIVLTGAGERAFSAGYDIDEMKRLNGVELLAQFAARDPLLWKIANHRLPIIVAMNGISFGAGALIAAAADIRVGSNRTRFKVTATKYNGANATWILPHIVGIGLAKEILFTSREIEGEEALKIGLLNQLVAHESVLEKAMETAALIAALPPDGVPRVKQLINSTIGRSFQDQFQAEHAAQSMGEWLDGEKLFAADSRRTKH